MINLGKDLNGILGPHSVLFSKMISSGGNKESVYQEEMVEWKKELKEA